MAAVMKVISKMTYLKEMGNYMKSGHVYIGSWKDGKMDGIGEFKYRDGHILQV